MGFDFDLGKDIPKAHDTAAGAGATNKLFAEIGDFERGMQALGPAAIAAGVLYGPLNETWVIYRAGHEGLGNGLVGRLEGALWLNRDASPAEWQRMQKPMMRGVLGAMAGVTGLLCANMAIDRFLYNDKPRGGVTNVVDNFLLPAVFVAPSNVWVKSALCVGLHTLAREVDKWKDRKL